MGVKFKPKDSEYVEASKHIIVTYGRCSGCARIPRAYRTDGRVRVNHQPSCPKLSEIERRHPGLIYYWKNGYWPDYAKP
jgi:hypothetical protein